MFAYFYLRAINSNHAWKIGAVNPSLGLGVAIAALLGLSAIVFRLGAMRPTDTIGAGIADGLGFGDNTKAALITRGLADLARLGVAMGGDPLTFAGLAGMGDLIVTCFSAYGRNRRAGELIARGRTPDEAVREIGQVVEGLTTAPALRALSHRLGVELPITEGVCNVLAGEDLQALLSALMGRQPTEE